MIARGFPRCSNLKLRVPAYSTATRASPFQCRRFSMPTSTPPSPSPAPISSTGMMAPITDELYKTAPHFSIHGSQIQILQTPAEFYETLKTKIRSAERQIFLSTLYIGKTEKELIITLQEALRNKPHLKLSILTDALRGTREAPDPSCASLLAPLVQEFGPDRVEIRMYHTPNLTGVRKKYVPRRINEGWGLQHMKLYGVDDEIILSGANLSSDYFTNRQDRYHLFSSRDITSFFWNLHSIVCSASFRVEPSSGSAGFELSWPEENGLPSPLENPKHFVSAATSRIHAHIKATPGGLASETKNAKGPKDTKVFMLGQLTQLLSPDTSTELPAITHLLQTLASPQYAESSWTFTAGYFNPAPSLTRLLLSTASQNNVVITASPQANGFYQSPGVSGLLPDAYTLLARRFVHTIHHHKREESIVLKEWQKGTVGQPGGWTYHAKGLWVTLPKETNPSISIVGSSNYTKRSYSLDLEAGALIATENAELKKRLGEEQRWLQEYAAPVTRDDFAKNERRVGLKVRIAMWIVQALGGAL